MANYNQRFITYDQYLALQQIGIPYEGFVRGLGYTYPQAYAVPPVHHQPHSQVQHVPDSYSFYSRGMMQVVDSSDEMRMRSYNLKPDDIIQQIVHSDGNGNVVINLGNGQFLTAPADNYKVDVRIGDGADGQMLNINATNTATGQQMTSMPSLLREFKKNFGELSKQPNQLKLLANLQANIEQEEISLASVGTAVGLGCSSMCEKQFSMALARSFKYTNSNTIIKPAEVMFKLPVNNAYLSPNVVKNSITTFKSIGWAGGVYCSLDTYNQWKMNQIDIDRFVCDEVSTVYSTIGGIPGASWGVGWELGRSITQMTWYNEWKKESWYPFREKYLGY